MRILKLFIALISFIAVFACEEKPLDNENCTKTEINKREYMMMCVSPQTFSTDIPAKIRIINRTKNDWLYGSSYDLDYFDENNWVNIPINLKPTLELNILRKGKTVELQMNLYSLVEKYNNSKKGMYRIIKSSSYNDPYPLYAEFEIK
jgi:hypothetical protein